MATIQIKLMTENGLLATKEKAILKASEEAKKNVNVSKAMNLKEAVDYLNK